MANSKSSSSNRSSDTSAALGEQAFQQMAIATETAAALCNCWESMQQVQQHSAQRTGLRLKQAAEQMRGLRSPSELMAIHTLLFSSSLQEMAQVLQDMTLSTLRLQGALLSKQEEASAAVRSTTDEGVQRAASGASSSACAANEAMHAATDAASAATAVTTAMWKSWSSMMGGIPSPSYSPDRGSRHH